MYGALPQRCTLHAAPHDGMTLAVHLEHVPARCLPVCAMRHASSLCICMGLGLGSATRGLVTVPTVPCYCCWLVDWLRVHTSAASAGRRGARCDLLVCGAWRIAGWRACMLERCLLSIPPPPPPFSVVPHTPWEAAAHIWWRLFLHTHTHKHKHSLNEGLICIGMHASCRDWELCCAVLCGAVPLLHHGTEWEAWPLVSDMLPGRARTGPRTSPPKALPAMHACI